LIKNWNILPENKILSGKSTRKSKFKNNNSTFCKGNAINMRHFAQK